MEKFVDDPVPRDSNRVEVAADRDILEARRKAREVAERLGFSPTDVVRIATAVSELTRNAILYAGRGTVMIQTVLDGAKMGIEVQVSDEGPGIPDVERALQDGYSTSGGMGLGLPGARRLMDEFEINSEIGRGTTVKVRKWKA